MRRVRTLAVLVSVAAALLVGTAAPARADAMLFGVYSTWEYCNYYGQSLTSGPQFDSYNCVSQNGAWYLYVW
ncbi:hypothetical protein WEI85_21835 [Actinomycetes bacterium KLBMP 9797]